jgi:hypothetical protein
LVQSGVEVNAGSAVEDDMAMLEQLLVVFGGETYSFFVEIALSRSDVLVHEFNFLFNETLELIAVLESYPIETC